MCQQVCGAAAQDRGLSSPYPFENAREVLPAGEQPLGVQDARLRVDAAVQNVDVEHLWAVVVRVLVPRRERDHVPRPVKVVNHLQKLHCCKTWTSTGEEPSKQVRNRGNRGNRGDRGNRGTRGDRGDRARERVGY